jgi:ubiquitin carboxyl-terminal hydrolase L3
MVPQPIEALICLFPVYDKITQYINETFPVDNSHPKAELFHMAQRIGNACGSFALFHTFLNLRQIGDVREDSILDQLLVKICELPPDADSIHCAEIFESQEGVEEIHQGQAVLGQTCNEDDEYEFTEVHYITFICKFDRMWLLDGAKRGPLDLGACTPDQLLSKAFKVASEMHKIWGKETDFAVLACSKLE